MQKERILCVDDDQLMLFSFQKDLAANFTVITAQDGETALSLLQKEEPFSVIVADMLMPGMNGIEVLAQAQCLAPDTVRIMLTGDEDKQTAVDAINEGRIFRFLTKPCAPQKLVAAIEAAVKQYRLVIAERELLEKTLNGSVNMLTELLATTEPDAFGRGQRVVEYVKAVAPDLGLTSTWDLELAALLAQLGLVTLPPTILQKVRAGIALKEVEQVMLNRVPEIGSKLLSKIPRLAPAAEILLHQNKGFDGSGFPAECKGGATIPLGARLLRVLADLVDLETKGLPKRKAFDQLRQNPLPYDPRIVEAVLHRIVEAPTPTAGQSSSIKDLVAGCELLDPIETTDGMLIAPAGTTLSETMIERIRNFSEIMGIREPVNVKFPVS